MARMRHIVGTVLALLLSAGVAHAGVIQMLAEGSECEAMDCVKLNHNHVDSTGKGDSHWDCELDTDYASDNKMICLFHSGYPVSGNDNGYNMRYTFETDEADTSKQICLRVTACAGLNADPWYDCSLTSGVSDVVVNLGSSGAAFARRFTTPGSTSATIRKTVTNVPCDVSSCGYVPVTWSVRLDNSIAGCTTPTANKVRVRSLSAVYQ